MKVTLSKLALIACVGTAAFTATSANAAQYRTFGCDIAFFEGCSVLVETPASRGRPNRDISPTYMKQTDPRYISSMRDAGGGGGGGGGGGR